LQERELRVIQLLLVAVSAFVFPHAFWVACLLLAQLGIAKATGLTWKELRIIDGRVRGNLMRTLAGEQLGTIIHG
jgi:hypothetical protein